MAESLLMTRGEKGDTGPKGDPGTPTTSQATSMLGLKFAETKNINQTFTIPYARYSSDYPCLNVPYTSKNSEQSGPFIFIESLSCTASAGANSGGSLSIYTHGWEDTSDYYHNLNRIFTVEIGANQFKNFGTVTNIATVGVQISGHGRYIGIYGFGSAYKDSTFTVTLTGKVHTYFPTWATVT